MTTPARSLVGAAIERVLPHRFPFLLVDRIDDYEPGRWIVGVKNVAAVEPLLVESGTTLDLEFAIEIIGQLGIALHNLSHGHGHGHGHERPADILLGSISGVEYLGEIPLGSSVHARAEVTKVVGDAFTLRGEARVEGQVVLRIDTVVVTAAGA